MKNVYLVGFMGTGKTAVGKALAKREGLTFLDLDDLIVEKEGTQIVEIFEKMGEPYFRDLESEVLTETTDKEGLVVACGGGIVLNGRNISLMEAAGLVVCLDATAEVIYERTKEFAHRPLLNVKDPQAKIKELLDKRAPFYAKVKTHVATSDLSIEDVVNRIVAMVENG